MLKNLTASLIQTSKEISFGKIRQRLAVFTPRFWWLLIAWSLFTLLVLFKINGSSIDSSMDDLELSPAGGFLMSSGS
jgi:hypothetical protein